MTDEYDGQHTMTDVETEEPEESLAANGDDIQAPEAVATRKEMVEFLNDQLEGALTEDGGIYLSVPGMCKALGLYSPSQVRRIKATEVLFKGLRRFLTMTKGGPQPVNFLRVDMVSLWLAGIETAKMRGKTDEQRFLRDKIRRYQEELAPIATQVFLRVLNESIQPVPITPSTPTESPLLLSIAQQLHEISGTVPAIHQGIIDLLGTSNSQTIKLESLLEIVSTQAIQLESLLEIASSQTLDLKQALELLTRYLESQTDIEEKLERVDVRTKRLSPAHALEVQNAVGHIVKLIQRKNSSVSDQIANRMVYGRLKSRFRPAVSYKDIDDDRFEEVMDYLRREYRTILEEGPKQEKLF